MTDERLRDGVYFEEVAPVMKSGGFHHITETTIKGGKVVHAFSNSCDGITFAPGATKVSMQGRQSWFTWVPWDEVSHFEDSRGNRYEKQEDIP